MHFYCKSNRRFPSTFHVVNSNIFIFCFSLIKKNQFIPVKCCSFLFWQMYDFCSVNARTFSECIRNHLRIRTPTNNFSLIQIKKKPLNICNISRLLIQKLQTLVASYLPDFIIIKIYLLNGE